MTDRLIFNLIVLISSVAMSGALFALLNFALFRRTRPVGPPIPHAEPECVFLFEHGILADATPSARHFLDAYRSSEPDLNNVVALLSRSFPDLTGQLRRLLLGNKDSCDLILAGSDMGNEVRVESRYGIVRLTLVGPIAMQSDTGSNRIASLENELEVLRSIAEDAPQLIWKQDDTGRLTWANSAYLRLADRVSPSGEGDPLWPANPIFVEIKPVVSGDGTVKRRVPILLSDMAEPLWFDVTSIRRGAETAHFAADASSLIQAEAGRHKFVQTLAKTFAHLTIGLAIFDRNRRLALFNPAFLDLTGLPVAFLSSQPLVNAVLDRLHDNNMLPEPRNYSNWRDQVAALEAEAVRGTYCETWALPSGQTYRVTGRPHPDGAIAFLFEDISDEIRLTRQFRSELETAQAALDFLDEAIAVFSRAGTLVMSNAGYARLSGISSENLTDISLADEVARWRARSDPASVWDQVLRGLDANPDRRSWRDRVQLRDGRALVCRVGRLSGGNILIGLRETVESTKFAEPEHDVSRPQLDLRVVVGV